MNNIKVASSLPLNQSGKGGAVKEKVKKSGEKYSLKTCEDIFTLDGNGFFRYPNPKTTRYFFVNTFCHFLINFLKNILLKTIDKQKRYRYNGTQFTNECSEIRVEKWTRNGKFMRCIVQIAGKSYTGIRIKAGG